MKKSIIVIMSVLLSFLGVTMLFADPVTKQHAQKAAMKWLSDHKGRPLKTNIAPNVWNVEIFRDDDGNNLYYVINFNPTGFVIVSADDLIEPIIAFAEKGSYTSSNKYPLGALVSGDMRHRRDYVKNNNLERSFPDLSRDIAFNKAKNKWNALLFDYVEQGLEMRMQSLPKVRVSPLLESIWDQETVGSNYCYNYWTPNHYPSGCVATAIAQLIRYHSYPTSGIGKLSFSITVDGSAQTVQTHGGDNAGGAYVWNSMPLSPNAGTPDNERRQIGYLLADAGYAVNMDYTAEGSGANTLDAASALKYPFQYSNAIKGYNSGSNIPSTSYVNMINTNLDAALPVLFGITGTPGGHAIVGDGYGYDASQTMYHHLNLGWGSTTSGLTANVWYNLPNIDTPFMTFNTLYRVVYNVFKTGKGEVVSGRVTDGSGNPINGVTVTGNVSGGGTFSYVTGTDAKIDSGIYALKNVPSNSLVTLTAVKPGYQFSSQTVTTGRSTDLSSTSGNIGNVNFQGQTGTVFADVLSSYWAYDYIMATYNAGYTTGAGAGTFAPELNVNREQMAAFIVRAVEGEPPEHYCSTDIPFLDISAGSWSCGYIKRLFELGITTGYGDGRYGPNDLVTRAQMAAFIVRAVEGEPAYGYCSSGVLFTDVIATDLFCGYIKRLYELGITTGYGDGRYGPNDLVTRGQMAVFLGRAFLGM